MRKMTSAAAVALGTAAPATAGTTTDGAATTASVLSTCLASTLTSTGTFGSQSSISGYSGAGAVTVGYEIYANRC